MMCKIVSSFLTYLQRFRRSESGMTLPLMAASMVMITSVSGMAIDVARMQLVQSKLQFSLDSAGLAAGSTVNTASLTNEVTKYLNTNFNGYMGSTITNTATAVDTNNTLITLTATATFPTAFMGIVGIDTITLTASTEVSRAITGLELVMVLDNTGSMTSSAGGGTSKIQALKTAATTLVNTLFAGKTVSTDGKLWVGIVPFSQAVNIGTTHDTWMDSTYNATLTDWGPGGGWAGCVDARSNGLDVTDDPPVASNTSTLFRQYYWTSDYYNTTANAGFNKWKQPAYNRCKAGICNTVHPTCSTSGGYTCTPTSPWYASPLNTSNQGPNLMCPQAVTPMTNTAATLTSAINTMVAQGNTIVNQGLAWGWNMISPRWRGLWGGTMNANSLPLDYDTHGMIKAIVLLTDGQNTIDNTAHGAYWFLGDNRLGTTNASSAVTEMDSRTRQLCTAMKNKGIYIYTIALGTDVPSSSLSLLQSCATASNYYFNSPSTSQLQGIFSTIGDSLSNLRVSK